MEYVLIAIVVVPALLLGALVLAQSGEPPSAGQPAPALDLPGTDGTRHALARGRRAVVFFFPMDDTPECLAVLAKYREAHPRLEAAGVRLLAVAVATPEAARAYAEAQSLPFPILADEGGRVAKAWGTFVNLLVLRFSKKFTALVGEGGAIERAWRDAAGPGHVDDVLAHVERRPA